jgi:hypothetical protein
LDHPYVVQLNGSGGTLTPLRFIDIQVDASLARIHATSTPGQRYVLQSSADLIQWKSISTNTATSTTLEFQDVVGSNTLLFYRAITAE